MILTKQKLEKMIKPDPVYIPKMLSKPTTKTSESNIDFQHFDNSVEIPKGEGNGKLFAPILTVIALVTIVGLSVYLINRYNEEEKKKTF